METQSFLRNLIGRRKQEDFSLLSPREGDREIHIPSIGCYGQCKEQKSLLQSSTKVCYNLMKQICTVIKDGAVGRQTLEGTKVKR